MKGQSVGPARCLFQDAHLLPDRIPLDRRGKLLHCHLHERLAGQHHLSSASMAGCQNAAFDCVSFMTLHAVLIDA